eukprot:scaffold37064_cov68-Phaeocystis_antarctica.AAC.1
MAKPHCPTAHTMLDVGAWVGVGECVPASKVAGTPEISPFSSQPGPPAHHHRVTLGLDTLVPARPERPSLRPCVSRKYSLNVGKP